MIAEKVNAETVIDMQRKISELFERRFVEMRSDFAPKNGFIIDRFKTMGNRL